MYRSPLTLLRLRTQGINGMRCRECILLFLRNKLGEGRRCHECERLQVMQLIYDLRLKFGYLLYDE